MLVLAYQKRLWIKAGYSRVHPKHILRDPFIIFHSVRKSKFCTEILIKLRPLAIARTSLIYAFCENLDLYTELCGDQRSIVFYPSSFQSYDFLLKVSVIRKSGSTLSHMRSKRKGKIRSTGDLRTAPYIRLREPKFGLRIESFEDALVCWTHSKFSIYLEPKWGALIRWRKAGQVW